MFLDYHKNMKIHIISNTISDIHGVYIYVKNTNNCYFIMMKRV